MRRKWGRGGLPSAPERSTHRHRWQGEEKEGRTWKQTKKYKNEKWGSIKTESAETESLDLLMREAQECGEPRWTAGPRVTDPRTQVHWRFTEDPGYQAFSHGSFRLVSVTKSRAGAVLSLSSHCVSKTAELSLVTNNRPLTHPATKNQNILKKEFCKLRLQ